MRQPNIFQLDGLTVDVQIRAEAFNRFVEERAIVEQNVSLPVRIGPRPRKLQLKIQCSGNWICVSSQRENPGQISISSIEVCLERAAIGELPVTKTCMEIKLKHVGITTQGAITHGEHVWRERAQNVCRVRVAGAEHEVRRGLCPDQHRNHQRGLEDDEDAQRRAERGDVGALSGEGEPRRHGGGEGETRVREGGRQPVRGLEDGDRGRGQDGADHQRVDLGECRYRPVDDHERGGIARDAAQVSVRRSEGRHGAPSDQPDDQEEGHQRAEGVADRASERRGGGPTGGQDEDDARRRLGDALGGSGTRDAGR